MKKPRKITDSVYAHISNARYYLNAAQRLPSPISDGVRILLLLTSWENIKIAEEELHAWAQGSKPRVLIYKSHRLKFEDVWKPIVRVILGPRGTPAKQVEYSTAKQLEKLLEVCRYGPKDGSRELAPYFERRWFTDGFQRGLESKIGWQETYIEAIKHLRKLEEADKAKSRQ